MASQETPWDPLVERDEDEEPFVTLLDEARAALKRPGASVEDIKRKYRRAISRGFAHLDVPSIDTIADDIAEAEIPTADYDDGPFADFAPLPTSKQIEDQPLRRPSRRPRPTRSPPPPPAPKPSPVDRVLKLLGR